MSYGGTDSSNGTYGPVGTSSGSEPQPSSGGTVGPAGPPGPPGPSIDRYAATRIVSLDPDQGTDTTIQAAVDALPAEGGLIFVREGTYVILASILLPDKEITFVFASGSILSVSGNVRLFQVSDGLTTARRYQFFGRPIFQGDPAANQTVFTLDDVNGLGDIVLENALVTGFATFADWTKYDTNYLRQSNVYVNDSRLVPIAGGSFLVKTPNAGGSYFAAVGLRCKNAEFTWAVYGGTETGWKGDADVDLYFEDKEVSFLSGSIFNGIACDATSVRIVGAGDLEFWGNGWDVYDYMIGGLTVFSNRPDQAPPFNADSRLISHAGVFHGDLASALSVALKFFGIVDISIGFSADTVGLSNPGIELVGSTNVYGSTVHHTRFFKLGSPVTAFPQDCVRLTDESFCKVHDCDFKTTITGRTVHDDATSTKNMVHNCTRVNSGTGLLLDAGSVAVNNLN